jgi:hypothetical protein
MAFDAVWSPAGDLIAFCVGRYFRTPGLPASQVALIRPGGSGFRPIGRRRQQWFPELVAGREADRLQARPPARDSVAGRWQGHTPDGRFTLVQLSAMVAKRGRDHVLTSDRDDDFELYTIRPDGTGLRRLTNSPGNDAHSIWSPDGEWIVFSSARMGFKDEMALYDGVPQPYGEIVAMLADGSDLRQLTDNKWEDASPGWMPERKDSERITAARPK